MVSRRGGNAALNKRVLVPLLLAAMLMQIAVPLIRIATSYRAVELDLTLVQISALSSAFALLPVLFAVRIGQHNDLHGEGSTALVGAIVVAVAVLGLWWISNLFVVMLGFTCLLGIGQVMLLSALQMMTTRCSDPTHHDRVLGYFLVATSFGQVMGPLAIGLTTPDGALYPNAGLYWLVAGAVVLLMICALLLRTGLPIHVPPTDLAAMRIRKILRTPGLLVIILSSSLCLATNDLMIVFFPVLGAARGIDAAAVGFLLSLRALASMASRFFFARLIVRISKKGLMKLALLLTALTTGALVLEMPLWVTGLVLTGSGFMMGLAVACSISLTLTMDPASGRAMAMSLRLMASRLGQFLLPLGAGAAATLLGPGSIFAIMGLGLLACGVLVGTVPRQGPA